MNVEEQRRSEDEREVGEAFADPNSADDRKLGKAFDETTSNAKKPGTPLRDRIHAPKNRKPLVWFLIAAVLLFLVVLLVGWLPRHSREKETRQRAGEQRTEKPLVEAVRVQRAESGSGLVIPGTATPLTEAYVYARANGYLKRRLVDIGDRVHKGQLLATIEAPDLDQQVDQAREQVRQAEAQVAQQETQLALTRVTVERYRVLVVRGVFSRQDGDQREADYQAQLANVASAERNVQAFQANLRRVIALQSFERVTAPFDGVITARNVDVGALISTSGSGGGSSPMSTSGTGSQAGTTNNTGVGGSELSTGSPSTGGAQGGALFSIAQVQRLRLLVSVPEGYAAMVAPKQHAAVSFQELPNQRFFGDVTRTSKSIDQNTRTLLVEVQLDNRAGKLMPGMYAVVTFPPAESGAGSLVVSGDAIAIRNDRPVVAVIADDGTVHLQPVVIGRDFGSETEIVGGLREGQTIASTFTDDVREGLKVRAQVNKSAQQKATPQAAAGQVQPPGGSTQYGDPGITDQDMQGQNAKPQQKGQGAGGTQKKGSGDSGGKP